MTPILALLFLILFSSSMNYPCHKVIKNSIVAKRISFQITPSFVFMVATLYIKLCSFWPLYLSILGRLRFTLYVSCFTRPWSQLRAFRTSTLHDSRITFYGLGVFWRAWWRGWGGNRGGPSGSCRGRWCGLRKEENCTFFRRQFHRGIVPGPCIYCLHTFRIKPFN